MDARARSHYQRKFILQSIKCDATRTEAILIYNYGQRSFPLNLLMGVWCYLIITKYGTSTLRGFICILFACKMYFYHIHHNNIWSQLLSIHKYKYNAIGFSRISSKIVMYSKNNRYHWENLVKSQLSCTIEYNLMLFIEH